VGAGCAVALLWAAAIVIAPCARPSRHPIGTWVGVVYLTGSLVCHQRDERSFHREAIAFPVCARCTGLYLGAPLGMLAVLLAGRSGAAGAPAGGRVRWWLAAAAAPTVVSITFEWGDGPSSLTTRALAALPLGVAVGSCVALALAEIGSRPMSSGARTQPADF
jgi:Predicted membrane protein (DUF2085)